MDRDEAVIGGYDHGGMGRVGFRDAGFWGESMSLACMIADGAGG